MRCPRNYRRGFTNKSPRASSITECMIYIRAGLAVALRARTTKRTGRRAPRAPAAAPAHTIMVASMKACSILHAYALLMRYASSVK